MIAARVLPNVRTARHATTRRVKRASRARYTGLLRFCAVLAVVLLGLMTYVMLTSRLTGLNYAVAKAQHERAVLQSQTARLDDRIAALSSDDRLARVAARLHMQDPQQFALVTLPPRVQPAPDSRLAFLSTLTGFFRSR